MKNLAIFTIPKKTMDFFQFHPGRRHLGVVPTKRGRHLLTLCPLILSVFLDRIYRINWMFFLFSLSGRKGERESAIASLRSLRRGGRAKDAKESFYVRQVKRRT
ncbi:MAG: hypothetical protein R6T98_14870 [Desulfatiglandales bacterium]